jgi:hypothetical protein
LEPDGEGGGVVAIDDPVCLGHQGALQVRERLLVERFPVLVVVQGVKVDGFDAEVAAE